MSAKLANDLSENIPRFCAHVPHRTDFSRLLSKKLLEFCAGLAALKRLVDVSSL